MILQSSHLNTYYMLMLAILLSALAQYGIEDGRSAVRVYNREAANYYTFLVVRRCENQ